MLALNAISKRFAGRSNPQVDDVCLTVDSGEIVAIVGPSGAGKTTLLRIVAGLGTMDSGSLHFAGRSIAADSPQDRRFALLFQDDVLLPMLSVRAHLTMVSRVSHARMAEIVELLDLDGLLLRRVGACSGGERQRIAFARALASAPRAMLYDEPLAHIDPQGRSSALALVGAVSRAAGGPALYVTHDHAEAMTVGTRIAVLIDGRVEQIGPPQAVYDAPATIRVAQFLGEPPMNVSERLAAHFGFSGMALGFRPHCARICDDGDLRGRVLSLTRLGSDVILLVATTAGDVHVRVDARDTPAVNANLGLHIHADDIHRFDLFSGARIP